MKDFNFQIEKAKEKMDKSEIAIVPLRAELPVNAQPFQIYAALREITNSKFSFLLESIEGEERVARYSFIGAAPELLIQVQNKDVIIKNLGGLQSNLLFEIARRNLVNSCCSMSGSGPYAAGKLEENKDPIDAISSIFINEFVRYIPLYEHPRQLFFGGALGYFSYDMVDYWLKLLHSESFGMPEAEFILSTRSLVYDHKEKKVYAYINAFVTNEASSGLANDCQIYLSQFIKAVNFAETSQKQHSIELRDLPVSDYQLDMTKPEFEEAVQKAKDYIFAGDIFQVVLARQARTSLNSITPFDIYMILRQMNPSPYMYLLEFREHSIVGASPETLVTVCNRKVITNPIAGTRPRGKTPEEDQKLEKEMLNDEKEKAEHVMLVDLARNDVGIVSKPGTVRVTEYMVPSKYSHVQHIVSTVVGELKDDKTTFDAIRAIFPAGTVSGAPKIRAMEIIDELEKGKRGPYAGGVGYFAFDLNADFAITIRSVVIDKDTAFVQAGAGIVADSKPEREFFETQNKMLAILKTIEVAKARVKD